MIRFLLGAQAASPQDRCLTQQQPLRRLIYGVDRESSGEDSHAISLLSAVLSAQAGATPLFSDPSELLPYGISGMSNPVHNIL